jgi:hypothetical protein
MLEYERTEVPANQLITYIENGKVDMLDVMEVENKVKEILGIPASRYNVLPKYRLKEVHVEGDRVSVVKRPPYDKLSMIALAIPPSESILYIQNDQLYEWDGKRNWVKDSEE